MSYVHPQHDVRLATIAPERPLPGQQSEEDAGAKGIRHLTGDERFHGEHYGETISGSWCFTVMIPVEHTPAVQSRT
jgi:hypothetical protein